VHCGVAYSSVLKNSPNRMSDEDPQRACVMLYCLCCAVCAMLCFAACAVLYCLWRAVLCCLYCTLLLLLCFAACAVLCCLS